MAEPAGEADVNPGKRNWPGGLVWAHVAPPVIANNKTAATDGRNNGQEGVLNLVIVGKSAGCSALLTQVLVSRNVGFQCFQGAGADT